MSCPRKPLSSRRRSTLSFQTLEDRRVLAATTPDVIELTNSLGPYEYAGPFEQRTVIAPQYITDAQGNRAIDLRVDVPGDQTVWRPSIGVNDAGPYGGEQSQPITRVLVRPNQRYVIEHRYSEGGIPISAFNASGELIERLILATDPSDTDDQHADLLGRYLAYIGDISWSDAPALKLPPTTASIVFTQSEVISIGFLGDAIEGASKTATWGSEPIYSSSKPVDLIEADDPIPVDGTKRYQLDASVNSVGAAAKHSVGYTAYDRDGLMIEPQQVTRYLFAADTTLARELKPGDTSIELSDATGWSNLSSDPNTRALAWYGYRDASGQTYDDYTYTRNVASTPGLGLWSAGAVVGNRIALRTPWDGPTLASGSAVRNAVTGKPLFPVLGDDVFPTLSGAVEVAGFWRNGSQSNASFPPATAIIRPAAELNQALTFSGTSQLSYRYRVASDMTTTVQGSNFREVMIDVLANDHSVGASPRINGVTTPKFGVVQIVNDSNLGRQTLKYTSTSYFIGVDRFTYTVTNEAGVSFTEQVAITSLGNNLESNPTLKQAIEQSGATAADEIRWIGSNSTVYQVLQGAELNVTGGATPLLLEGLGSGTLPKFVSLERPPEHGSFKMEPNGAFRYIADANYSGRDRIDLRVSNGVRTRIESVSILIGASPVEVDQGKLGQIGGALESVEGTFRRYFYPTDPTYFDATGKPLLSWRVHALPFLGFQELYNRFRLNEPWNSPNNLPLASQMPDIYRSWGDVGDNLTRFQTIQAGQPSTAFWIDADGVPRRNSQSNATHGAGNSILVLQTNAANAVLWTRPEDLVFTDPQSTLAKLTAPLFPAYFWHQTRSTFDAVLVPQDLPAGQFHSIATINETSGALGVDVPTLARGWAERPDTPITRQQYGVRKATENIQFLSVAFSNYHNAFQVYPKSGTTSPTGQPLLSWRVQLLPFLGLGDLYSRFKLNEAWDSPNNFALLNQMPDVFRSALDPSTSTTTRMRVIDGTGAAFDGTKTRIRRGDFLDGLSNTILFVEAGIDKAVPWTQPEAIPVDMSKIWEALGNFPDGFMRIGMGDTSVGKLGTAAPNAEIAALLTTGLRAPSVRAEEELYDGLTLMERSGFPALNSASVNLRILAQASNNFYDAFKAYPLNGYGALINGTSPSALLSWRVAILPFAEANRLFQKFNLQEAWDSPNNLALMKYMPHFLRSIGDRLDSTNTPLQSFVGSNSFINSTNKKLRLNDMTKGVENSLAFVNTGIDKSVPWTKPADVNAEAADIWKELGRVGQSARFSSTRQSFHFSRNQSSYLMDRTLSEAINVTADFPRTIIESNTLVLREGDFAKVDLMMTNRDDVMEMDPQSFLTMAPRMTFAAAENTTLDGTRKVQVRWGKRSDPADPNSPLIVSQTLDVYVIDNEPLLLGTTPSVVSENGEFVTFFVSRAPSPDSSQPPDLSLPLTVTISSDSPNRIQLPSTVIIPAGEVFTVFTGVTIDNSIIEGSVTIQVAASAPGRLDSVTQLSIADDDALRLTMSPSAIREKDGSTIGTITRLGGSLNQPLTVNLSSSNPTTARVPISLTIPAGSASANFTITAVSDDSFDGIQVVRISAEVGNAQRSFAQLTVYDLQPLQMQLSSDSMSESGGRASILVFRSGVPLDLPMVIQLRSSDTTELTVPATVTIPANQQAVSFEATAVDDQLLDGTQAVTITASSNAYDAGEAVISVNDHESLTLMFAESAISEKGGINRGRVSRSNIDIDQPLVVGLRSLPASPTLVFPSNVTIPAGSTYVDFDVTTLDDHRLSGTRQFTISAENRQYTSSSSVFEVTDYEELTLQFDRLWISENSDYAFVRLIRGNSDDLAQPLTVQLRSNLAGVIDLPATVTIPAGSAETRFLVSGIDNDLLESSKNVLVEAIHPSYITIGADIVVEDYETLSLQLELPLISEASQTIARVYRSNTNIDEALVVELQTITPGVVRIPTTVTIPAGSAFATFNIEGIDNQTIEPTRATEIKAVHPAYKSVPTSIAVSDYEPLGLSLSVAQQFEGASIGVTVTRNVDDISGDANVRIFLSDPTKVSGPTFILIPANERSVTFELAIPRDHVRIGDKRIDVGVGAEGFMSVDRQFTIRDLESLWHNPSSSLDVNDDGVVSPLDALLVINFLNIARGPVADLVRPGFSPLFLDTSDDGILSPLDALLIINHLNNRANGEGESSIAQNQPLGALPSASVVDEALWQLEEDMRCAARRRSLGILPG